MLKISHSRVHGPGIEREREGQPLRDACDGIILFRSIIMFRGTNNMM